MYQYTENIDVTDALEVNNHITIMMTNEIEFIRGLQLWFSFLFSELFCFLEKGK